MILSFLSWLRSIVPIMEFQENRDASKLSVPSSNLYLIILLSSVYLSFPFYHLVSPSLSLSWSVVTYSLLLLNAYSYFQFGSGGAKLSLTR